MGDVPLSDAELETLFHEFDLNGDGLLDCEEFAQMLKAMGDESSPETMSLQFAVVDEDGDGRITAEEFARWWRS